jgi:hypothetical protein
MAEAEAGPTVDPLGSLRVDMVMELKEAGNGDLVLVLALQKEG